SQSPRSSRRVVEWSRPAPRSAGRAGAGPLPEASRHNPATPVAAVVPAVRVVTAAPQAFRSTPRSGTCTAAVSCGASAPRCGQTVWPKAGTAAADRTGGISARGPLPFLVTRPGRRPDSRRGGGCAAASRSDAGAKVGRTGTDPFQPSDQPPRRQYRLSFRKKWHSGSYPLAPGTSGQSTRLLSAVGHQIRRRTGEDFGGQAEYK